MATVGIEPTTSELLAPRSVQTELCGLLIFLNYFAYLNEKFNLNEIN